MLLYGKPVADSIEQEVKEQLKQLNAINKCKLIIIRVGDNKASESYVRSKTRSCERVGILSEVIHLEEDITQNELIDIIHKLNEDKTVHGILVQLPLPKHINENVIAEEIDKNKDVDCFHPYNVGQFYRGQGVFKPCTPLGIIKLLKFYQIPIEGRKVTIIGRSNIVGRPMAEMILQENGLSTILHSKMGRWNLKNEIKYSDIVVSAVGKKGLITELQQYITYIDVGINRDEDNKLCGDISKDLYWQADMINITPVPKGVGLTTVAALMLNTLEAYKLNNKYI